MLSLRGVCNEVTCCRRLSFGRSSSQLTFFCRSASLMSARERCPNSSSISGAITRQSPQNISRSNWRRIEGIPPIATYGSRLRDVVKNTGHAGKVNAHACHQRLSPTVETSCGPGRWRCSTCIGNDQPSHVDDGTHRGGRGQHMHRLRRTQQHRTDRDVVACSRLEQTVRDVRSIDVRW